MTATATTIPPARAPHAASRVVGACSSSRAVVSTPPSSSLGPCQICFELAPDHARPVTRICTPTCPAVVCPSCLDTFVQTALASTPSGILPRIRCPVCLVRIAKSAWRRHVARTTIARYTSLCGEACSFVAACCHREAYTQLPSVLSACGRPATRFEQFMDGRIHTKLPALRERLHAFVRYETSARALVQFLDDVVDPLELHGDAYSHLMDSIAVRIRDDERRAALVIAFHSRHKRVLTRCCAVAFCFVCKRKWNDDHDADPRGPCDTEDLQQATDMVQCRACRVTLVKVEGCDSVACPCGFVMSWSDELRFVDEYQRKLIPRAIDVLNVEAFQCWDEWRRLVQTLVRWEIPALRGTWRRREIDRGIATSRRVLRPLLQTFIWRRRFREAFSVVTQQIHDVRRAFFVRRLRRSGFGATRGKFIQRIRWRLCLAHLQRSVATYDEETMDGVEAELALGLFA